MDIVESVCKYLSCSAAGDSEMISEASFRARDAFCSPSAAITLALASLGEKTRPVWLDLNVSGLQDGGDLLSCDGDIIVEEDQGSGRKLIHQPFYLLRMRCKWIKCKLPDGL